MSSTTFQKRRSKDTKDLYEKIKKGSKKDKSTFLAGEKREADETEQTRKMYHLTGSLDNKSKNLTGTILSREGKPITATAETLNIWAEHFKELPNCPPVETVQPRESAEQPLATVGTTSSTFVEVKEAMQRLNHKTAGTENIWSEL